MSVSRVYALIVPLVLIILSPLPALARGFELDPARGVYTLAPIVEEVTEAVVNISTERGAAAARDPLARGLFNLPQGGRLQSTGSGVIIDAREGLVLTNHHVVAGADRVIVTLKNRRTYPATVIGSDELTEIALLKIDAPRLSALPLGNSDDVKVGDMVLAIGNPFGLGQTVTSGIVSALGRSGIALGNYENFIQTDASINPGNSGGPLINTKGELIGINTAILAPGGAGNIGIGFAVPANMAKRVVEQLRRNGEVRRGLIGVQFEPLTPEAADGLGLASAAGALIVDVLRGSPAESAGLRIGDVILAVDGVALIRASDLRNRIGLMERGEKVDLSFYRDGQRRTVSVEIAAPPEPAKAAN